MLQIVNIFLTLLAVLAVATLQLTDQRIWAGFENSDIFITEYYHSVDLRLDKPTWRFKITLNETSFQNDVVQRAMVKSNCLVVYGFNVDYLWGKAMFQASTPVLTCGEACCYIRHFYVITTSDGSNDAEGRTLPFHPIAVYHLSNSKVNSSIKLTISRFPCTAALVIKGEL